MKTLFDISKAGAKALFIDSSILSATSYRLDPKLLRSQPARLPQVAENELARHYTALSKRAFGVDDGFYPLGSCTMKYNPKVSEKIASLEGFAGIHPAQSESDTQGILQIMYQLQDMLSALCGMDKFTLMPSAGAHGEYTSLQMIRAYHLERGDTKRAKIIVPDSAHGTNPASTAMAGFTAVNIPSKDGMVDLQALQQVVGEDTAGLMLTNPNTLGLFEKDILQISSIVHGAGGLLYYDGANLNAIVGNIRPGDMGFDIVHLNLHKTFSTPHGGGGPGSGPVGCKQLLAPYLPVSNVACKDGQYYFADPEKSIGRVKMYYGNIGVCLKAWAYIAMLGTEGLKDASLMAVLNANYMLAKLKDKFKVVSDKCMHEFVLSLQELKEKTGVSALDFAKAMIDEGMHPPTMYFPQIVKEALMIEPTETESKETLDKAIASILKLYEQAFAQPESMHLAPRTTPIGRPDEVLAARNPILAYEFDSPLEGQ